MAGFDFRLPRFLRTFGWWLAATVLLAAAAAAAHAEPAEVCVRLARDIERQENIPPGLVEAVALAESGRWLPTARHSRPWPWTVTSGSDTFYLASKEAALAKVRELRASGRTNIDVGCMQVNLGYHGHEFRSLEQALEPESNVAYGASFLKRLRTQTRSWARATARYHNSDPERGEAYRTKVYRLWNEVRQGLAHERRGARIVAGRPAATDGDTRAEAAEASPRMKTPSLVPPSNGAVLILRGQ